MSRFLIGIVSHGKGNVHAQCFMDFAKSLAAALRALGHEVEYATPEARAKPGRLIMFGSNNLVDDEHAPQIPGDAIIYNAEQLIAVADPRYFLQNYLQYRQFTVWDYAESNIACLKKIGIEKAILCPVGYVPGMERPTIVDYQGEQDIDVLFYGSTNPRRVKILDGLEAAGLHVVRPDKPFENRERFFGVYGDELDRVIARSKVVLNMHYYDYSHAIFEIFRVSHLLANKKCVVSEVGSDPGLDVFANRATALVGYDGLIEQCKYLVENVDARRDYEQRGHEEFTKLDLVENVRKAVEAS